jgi:hypothetical protein
MLEIVWRSQFVERLAESGANCSEGVCCVGEMPLVDCRRGYTGDGVIS